MHSGVFARYLSGRVWFLFNHLSVHKELLIMSLIIFSVFLLVPFLGRIYTEGTDRAAKGPADDIFSESRSSDSLL